MKPTRTVVITGSNTGIGAACALLLAKEGVHLVLACRSEERAAPVLARIRERGATASFLGLDLGDLAQSAAAGEALARRHETIDLLINNAGLAGRRGLTSDGYEIAFGTNHLAHFAFTLPLVARVAGVRGRVVNVSSGNHRDPKGIPWEQLRERTRSFSGMSEYGVSKLCNVLFTAELRRRVPDITAVSMNPGRIASDIWRSVPQPFRSVLPTLLAMKPVEIGGGYLVHAAEVALEGDDAPIYFDKGQAKPANPLALREDLAAQLWDYSAAAVARACSRPAGALQGGPDEGPAHVASRMIVNVPAP
ncbi:MAG TPA: SDR family NAD(P)-dependent oxidoreductase [Labilithrix sp.]|nr:SDR family NAD(P)-dependent oxidoreductase [Labilithrix sp.]